VRVCPLPALMLTHDVDASVRRLRSDTRCDDRGAIRPSWQPGPWNRTGSPSCRLHGSSQTPTRSIGGTKASSITPAILSAYTAPYRAAVPTISRSVLSDPTHSAIVSALRRASCAISSASRRLIVCPEHRRRGRPGAEIGGRERVSSRLRAAAVHIVVKCFFWDPNFTLEPKMIDPVLFQQLGHGGQGDLEPVGCFLSCQNVLRAVLCVHACILRLTSCS